ncbi:conjugative transposon protein TraN [Sunxiuqinia indica]|uniref:conjugative transposon protein TraN n=1 Tax=Sunxiuqinia indica TaxID=2692584 RepID=UPI00135834A4|nr:conjugative transposon protein TraN [Sunxiuqinia indica]
MKTLLIIILLSISQLPVISQNRLSVTEHKATHLVCPDRISYLQVGDPTLILAEKVPELPNMVRIKATQPFEKESSLTIVCAGRVYSLLINYRDTDEITYKLESFQSQKAGKYTGGMMPDYVLKELCDQVLAKRHSHVRRRKLDKDGIRLKLKNIYLSGDALLLELEISNKTNVAYRVDGFHWWIDDRKQHKATNVQEYEIVPVYQRYDLKVIPGGTTIREVFVFPKLTIPGQRILRIELLEKALGNTGRNLSLEVKNKDILRALKL